MWEGLVLLTTFFFSLDKENIEFFTEKENIDLFTEKKNMDIWMEKEIIEFARAKGKYNVFSFSATEFYIGPLLGPSLYFPFPRPKIVFYLCFESLYFLFPVANSIFVFSQKK